MYQKLREGGLDKKEALEFLRECYIYHLGDMIDDFEEAKKCLPELHGLSTISEEFYYDRKFQYVLQARHWVESLPDDVMIIALNNSDDAYYGEYN